MYPNLDQNQIEICDASKSGAQVKIRNQYETSTSFPNFRSGPIIYNYVIRFAFETERPICQNMIGDISSRLLNIMSYHCHISLLV